MIQIGAGVLIALIYVIAGMAGISQRWLPASQWVTAILIAFVFLLQFAYFALFEILWGGQTPGKRAIGIRVIKDTGRPLSPVEFVGRNLLRIVDQMPGFYAVGVLIAMFNGQSKRLGDFVAGSIVVREKSLEEIKRAWASSTPTSTSQLFAGAQRLTPEEIALIEAFLTRRHDLDPGVRHRMAQEILRRIESKLTLTDDHRTRVESTLESLAHEHRSHGRY